MTTIKRLDRLIVRLCYIRNVLSKYDHLLDIPIDLGPVETETQTIYDATLEAMEEIRDDNARD